MERAKLYKIKKPTFTTKEARLGRALDIKQERTNRRAQEFNQARNVPDVQEDGANAEAGVILDRRKRLELWKAQKNLKKKMESANKKPAFVVGVTRHKIYSPKATDPPTQHCHGKKAPPKKASPVKRITRATAKRLAAKAKSPAPVKAKAPGTPGPVNKLKTPGKSAETLKPRKLESIAPDNYVFKPPSKIKPILMETEGSISKSDINEFIYTSFKTIDNNLIKNNHSKVDKVDDSLDKESKDFADVEEEEEEKVGDIPTTLEDENEAADDRSKTTDKNNPTDAKPEAIDDKNVTLDVNNVTFDDKNVTLDDKNEAEEDAPFLAALSPFIVTGRGQRGKKEQRDRLLNNSLGETPTKETIQQMLNSSTEDYVKIANYYRHMLQQETNLLNDLCTKWTEIKKDVSEEPGCIIQQAIGQSQLLIAKKFGRFSKLVDDCESNNQESLVRSNDLRGFWEMMEPEIKNCHHRFANVEKLRDNNWIEDEEKPAKMEIKKKGRKPVKKVEGKSNMKAFIEAARMKKLQDKKLTDKTPEGRILRSRAQKTPEVQLDSSISYINSHQTPGKSILKKKTDTKDLNKSITKVNFSILKEADGEIKKKLNYDDENLSEAAKMLSQKLFKGNKGGLSNITRVNVRAAKKDVVESPKKTPKRRSIKGSIEKENTATPRRRSARRSMKHNISDDCTAC